MISLDVMCPRCMRAMRFSTWKGDISKSVKRCVYCGKNIKIIESKYYVSDIMSRKNDVKTIE